MTRALVVNAETLSGRNDEVIGGTDEVIEEGKERNHVKRSEDDKVVDTYV